MARRLIGMSTISRWVSVLANVSVIIGIAVLGVELHQNNRLLQQEARAVRIQFRLELLQSIYGDPEMARIIAARRAGDDIPEHDRLRHAFLVASVLVAWEHVYLEYVRGTLTRDDIPVSDWRLSFEGIGMREVWHATRDRYAPEFVQFMEDVIASEPGEQT